MWVNGSNLVADHTQPVLDLAARKIGKLSRAAAIFFPNLFRRPSGPIEVVNSCEFTPAEFEEFTVIHPHDTRLPVDLVDDFPLSNHNL